MTVLFTLHTKGDDLRDDYFTKNKYSPTYLVYLPILAWSSGVLTTYVTYKYFPLTNQTQEFGSTVMDGGRAGLVFISGCV